MLVITPEFVSMDCFFVDFAIIAVSFCGFTPEFMKLRVFFEMKTFVFDCAPDFVQFRVGPDSRIKRNEVFVPPPKICLCPPVMLSWRQAWQQVVHPCCRLNARVMVVKF